MGMRARRRPSQESGTGFTSVVSPARCRFYTDKKPFFGRLVGLPTPGPASLSQRSFPALPQETEHAQPLDGIPAECAAATRGKERVGRITVALLKPSAEQANGRPVGPSVQGGRLMRVEDGRKQKRWGYQPSARFVADVAYAFRTCNQQREQIKKLKRQIRRLKEADL